MHYYTTANTYFKNKFGCKVYKIAIDGGMSCPNRNADGSGGCIFCSEGGSGDFAEKPCGDINLQIERAITRVKDKNPQAFIAYFQSYTNTFAPVEYLEKLFGEAIENPKVCALSIATRPDCLPKPVLDLLSRLNSIKPVFVELGLQTKNDNTAILINRGYETQVFANAVENLKKHSINVIAHVILGLPGETKNDALETVKYAVSCGIDGIKLQLLHVLKNTALENMFNAGQYKPLEKEEYINLLCKAVECIPQNVVIHRLTGDAPKKLLIAPLWSANKKDVLNTINQKFKQNDIKPIE